MHEPSGWIRDLSGAGGERGCISMAPNVTPTISLADISAAAVAAPTVVAAATAAIVVVIVVSDFIVVIAVVVDVK